MGNIQSEPDKIKIDVKKRQYEVIKVHIPYDQIHMIRVLQKEFSYEVKGTIYVDNEHKFVSFEVRTDSSETYSYGASDWRISFHTHPDKTAQKYGMRYFSPPSVDDVLEIYDHSLQYVPDTTQSGFGEISIILANEGIYVLQVNRDNFTQFNKEDLPSEGLEEILKQTLTEFMVAEVQKGISNTIDGQTINTVSVKSKPASESKTVVNFEAPDITADQFSLIVRRLSKKVTELYGFDMSFYSWKEVEKNGITLTVCDYFLNKRVVD
jgi:hypothetical protein